jgi:hypothetical protein
MTFTQYRKGNICLGTYHLTAIVNKLNVTIDINKKKMPLVIIFKTSLLRGVWLL